MISWLICVCVHPATVAIAADINCTLGTFAVWMNKHSLHKHSSGQICANEQKFSPHFVRTHLQTCHSFSWTEQRVLSTALMEKQHEFSVFWVIMSIDTVNLHLLVKASVLRSFRLNTSDLFNSALVCASFIITRVTELSSSFPENLWSLKHPGGHLTTHTAALKLLVQNPQRPF